MTDLTAVDGTAQSQLIFGTMQFGGTANSSAAQAMFDACITAGITHFDTANVYTDGASETLLGQMIAPHRDSLIIATKVGYTGGGSAQNIRQTFDISRARMQQDMVDLLYMHRFDDETPLEETFEALADLQSRGQIRYIGVSNYAAWQVVKAQGVAARFDTKIDVIQPMYSLVKRQAEVELLPMAADLGILVAPYSPLGGGLLTGKYTTGGTGRLTQDSRYAARYAPEWMHNAASALADLAAEHAVSPATLAVAWAAAHSEAPVPIISARNEAQLTPSLAALRYEMPQDLYTQIEALTPRPAPATDRLEEA